MTTRGCVSVFPSLCLSDRDALLIISFLTSHDASHLKMLPSDATWIGHWGKTKYEAGFADHIWLQVVYCGLFAGVLPVVYSLFVVRDPYFDFSSMILYAVSRRPTHGRTNGPTDGPTNRRTDRAACRQGHPGRGSRGSSRPACCRTVNSVRL